MREADGKSGCAEYLQQMDWPRLACLPTVACFSVGILCESGRQAGNRRGDADRSYFRLSFEPDHYCAARDKTILAPEKERGLLREGNREMGGINPRLASFLQQI